MNLQCVCVCVWNGCNSYFETGGSVVYDAGGDGIVADRLVPPSLYIYISRISTHLLVASPTL